MDAQKQNETASADWTPRIYVASLADYNAGTLHGRWIDATQGVDHIRDEVNAMLFMSDEDYAEEWAIHDYENFGSLNLSEWESFETVAELGRLVVYYGDNAPVFLELVAYLGGTSQLDEARRMMEEGHQGAFQSLADYGEWVIQDGYSGTLEHVPAFIVNNIDYEGVAHDLELGGDIFTIRVEGLLHVFWANV